MVPQGVLIASASEIRGQKPNAPDIEVGTFAGNLLGCCNAVRLHIWDKIQEQKGLFLFS
jgi:hypothetical protein